MTGRVPDRRSGSAVDRLGAVAPRRDQLMKLDTGHAHA